MSDLKTSEPQAFIINPATNRKVKIGSTVYKKLMRQQRLREQGELQQPELKRQATKRKAVIVDAVETDGEEPDIGTPAEQNIEAESDLEDAIARQLSEVKFNKPKPTKAGARKTKK